MAWHHGDITVDGRVVSASVKRIGGVVKVDSAAGLVVGQTFLAYDAGWMVSELEPEREDGTQIAICVQAPAGAVKPPFQPEIA